MRMAPPRLLTVACLLAAGLAASALASDVLQLRDGKLVPGKVVKLDDGGVTFAPDAGGEIHVDWTAVIPRSRFDLWLSTLAPDDAAGRVALAKWALSADLHASARRELVKAKGLGYAGPEDVGALLAEVDRDEADLALSESDSLVAAGDLDKALERVKAYLRAAPPGPDADRVRTRVPDILARIEAREAQEKEAEEARKKAEKEGRLKDWIEKSLAAAKKAQDTAGERAASGFAELAKGNQTRARDSLSAAETGFQEARSAYRRVKKTAGPGEVAERCEKEMRDCDRRTVEVLTRWGRMDVENKAWRRASETVDRGLRIDPVDRELLELRRQIDENWIRRKLSDVTNAHPRESN